jgi:hypothetical protein
MAIFNELHADSIHAHPRMLFLGLHLRTICWLGRISALSDLSTNLKDWKEGR